MPTVRINTSDTAWIERHGIKRDGRGAEDMAAAIGTDVKGVMYFATETEVSNVEHVKFAGASMIRFDLGPHAPRDHNRYAMYPATYLVSEEGK
jgi:hypothetical protein